MTRKSKESSCGWWWTFPFISLKSSEEQSTHWQRANNKRREGRLLRCWLIVTLCLLLRVSQGTLSIFLLLLAHAVMGVIVVTVIDGGRIIIQTVVARIRRRVRN